MKFKTLMFLLVLSIIGNAYQLHIIDNAPETSQAVITNPEELQYFFGSLEGKPDYYTLIANEPFLLSARLLVPDVSGDAKQIMSLYISTEGRMPIFLIEPTPFEREPYYDAATGSWYILDASAEKQLDAGRYVIRVFNDNNEGKYTLSIGNVEDPPLVEKLVWSPILVTIKEMYLGRDIFLPAFHKFAVLIILAAFGALYTSTVLSQKSKESNRTIIDSFLFLKKFITAGLVLFFLTGLFMYVKHAGNPLIICEMILAIGLTLYWTWISVFGIGSKFSNYKDKKVFIKERYSSLFANRILILIGLWLAVLLMASVF